MKRLRQWFTGRRVVSAAPYLFLLVFFPSLVTVPARWFYG